MANTFNDTSTQQGLVQHLRFLSGQDALSIEDATRLINFALDDYSYIALTSSGRWKFDDSTHENADGDATYPIATATVSAGETSIPLETDFLSVEEVRFNDEILAPVDRRDYHGTKLTTLYGTSGTPRAYDYDSNALFLYPPPSTSGTVKLLYSRASPYFSTSDTTATVGIPRIHHEYLVLHALHRLSLRTNDSNRVEVRNELQAMEEKVRDFYSKRDQNTSRKLKAIINVPK